VGLGIDEASAPKHYKAKTCLKIGCPADEFCFKRRCGHRHERMGVVGQNRAGGLGGAGEVRI